MIRIQKRRTLSCLEGRTPIYVSLLFFILIFFNSTQSYSQEQKNPVLDLLDFNKELPIKNIVGIWELDTIAYIYADSTGHKILKQTNRKSPFPDHYKLIWQINSNRKISQYLKTSAYRNGSLSDLRIEYRKGYFKLVLVNPVHIYSDSIGYYYYSDESSKNEMILYVNCYPFLGYSASRYRFKRVKKNVRFKGLFFTKKKKLIKLFVDDHKDDKVQTYFLERGFLFASAFWSDIEIYKVDRARYRLKAFHEVDSEEIVLEFYDRKKLKKPKAIP